MRNLNTSDGSDNACRCFHTGKKKKGWLNGFISYTGNGGILIYHPVSVKLIFKFRRDLLCISARDCTATVPLVLERLSAAVQWNVSGLTFHLSNSVFCCSNRAQPRVHVCWYNCRVVWVKCISFICCSSGLCPGASLFRCCLIMAKHLPLGTM